MTFDTEVIDLWVGSYRFVRPIPLEAIALWTAATVPAAAALIQHRAVCFSCFVALALVLCGVFVGQGRPDRSARAFGWVALMALLLMVFWPGAVGPQEEMLSSVVVLGTVGGLIQYRAETRRTGS
ncbi:MAG: hypothetical protein QG622_3609 [Actinomycetota bacterium]|nr:hypothetical protein [Actinomycetota bacterium]